jgi:hypothetical protein
MDPKMDLFTTLGRVKGLKERIENNLLPTSFNNEEIILIMDNLLRAEVNEKFIKIIN